MYYLCHTYYRLSAKKYKVMEYWYWRWEMILVQIATNLNKEWMEGEEYTFHANKIECGYKVHDNSMSD